MTTAIQEYYITNDDGYGQSSTVYWSGQSFQAADSYSIEYVKLKLWKNPSVDPGTVTLILKAATGDPALPSGSILATGTTNGNTLPTTQETAEWRTITFGTSVALTIGSSYAYYLYPQNAGTYPVRWNRDQTSPTYDSTTYCQVFSNSVPPGSVWQAYTAGDMMFENWGTVTFEPPAGGSDLELKKRLVAAAANKIYYEAV